MTKKKTPYETLGVDKNASPSEIKKAMKEKAKNAHPDKGGSEEDMKEINKAYAILINPEKKKRYDETGEDDVKQSFESKFLSMINKLFLQTVENTDEEDVPYIDLVADLPKKFNDIAIQLEKQEKEFTKKLEKNKKVYERIKNKESAVGIVMLHEIESQEQTIQSIKKEKEFILECVEKSKEFEYKTEEQTEEYLKESASRRFTKRFFA